MDLVLGIDDAGRGPLIGPMALAGVLIEKSAEKNLKDIGVRDSKQLTPKRRAFLSEEIKKSAKLFKVNLIFPEEIDKSNKQGIKLNELEAMVFAKIINDLNKKVGNRRVKVIVDCPSPNIAKWKDFLKTKIEKLSNLEVVCEHKADRNHVSVSAASILAKEEREKEIEKIRQRHGEIGSGYPSDPKTKKFLKESGEKNQNKGIFRKSWSTWKKVHGEDKQKKLEF